MLSSFRDDTGSATAFGVATFVGLVFLLLIMVSAGSWLMARSHAASIADIAALAAAHRGSCEAAHDVAQMNHSRVLECVWQGSDVIVVVSTRVQVTPVALPIASVEVAARAGY